MWPTYKPISWDKYYAHNFSDKHASITSGLAAGITIGVFFTVFLLTFGCRIYSRRAAADATASRHSAEASTRLRRRPSVSQLFRASPPPPYELAIQMPKPVDLPPCGHFSFEPPPSFSELPPAEAPLARRQSSAIVSLPSSTTPQNGALGLGETASSESLRTSPKTQGLPTLSSEDVAVRLETPFNGASASTRLASTEPSESAPQRTKSVDSSSVVRSQTEFISVPRTSSSTLSIQSCNNFEGSCTDSPASSSISSMSLALISSSISASVSSPSSSSSFSDKFPSCSSSFPM